jgi:RNA polymerase sigma-70 factor, ECF subfamily
MDDQRLVAQAQRDPKAFGSLYDGYVDRVYRYCYRRTGSHYEAEELTAQTFRRALEALPKYEWRGTPFGAWLFRIAGNLIADRGKRREVPIDGKDFEQSDTEPIDGLLEAEEVDELWQAVYGLPLYQQQVLVLRYAQGLSTREVARIVNRSETATKQLVYRSLKTLRERLT